MLQPSLRRIVLPLVLALMAAPLAAAGLDLGDQVDRVKDTASDAHPWIGWTLDQLPQHNEGSGSDPQSGGSGSTGAGSNSPLDPVHPIVVIVVSTVDGALDGLDPIGLAEQQTLPVRQAAQELPVLLPATAEPQVTPPAPATASVREVQPDAAPLPAIIAAGTAAAAMAITAIWLAGSSGSLGAGGAAAGTAGKVGATDLRRLLPFASPLFTRFEKDTVLGHPKREALYALILQDPGVSLQSLCDSTGLSRTAVTHHLRLMELQHLIVSKRMGRSRHYYENGGRFGRDQKDAYAVLQNDRSKAVADFVKQNPGAIQKAICAAMAVQASVAHWHLKRLQEAQLVEAVRHGRTVSYFPGPGLKVMAANLGAAAEMASAPAPVPSAASSVPLTV